MGRTTVATRNGTRAFFEPFRCRFLTSSDIYVRVIRNFWHERRHYTAPPKLWDRRVNSLWSLFGSGILDTSPRRSTQSTDFIDRKMGTASSQAVSTSPGSVVKDDWSPVT